MTALATIIYTYILTAVYDLREIDEFTGERLPLEPGQGNICNRCGREHAKVYEVEREQDGKKFTVGSTCCKRLFGWEPEKEEIRHLEKEARKIAENRAYQRLLAIATPIAEEVKALPLPHIIEIERRDGRIPQTVWGAEGSNIKVWGLTQDGLTNERRDCFISSWKAEQARSRVDALYPGDSKKQYKLMLVIKDLLNVDFI
jgi:hypothetical protein